MKTKNKNTQSLPFSFDTKMAADGYLGMQIILEDLLEISIHIL